MTPLVGCSVCALPTHRAKPRLKVPLADQRTEGSQGAQLQCGLCGKADLGRMHEL